MYKKFLTLSLLILLSACTEQRVAPSLQSLDASIEEGKYLATLGNCYSCHTSESNKPFAGGLAFHTEFGLLFSTNITPDVATGIGTWSFENFYFAMKQGERPNGEHLYPAFPYTNFSLLSDNDIGSLWLYFQSLSPYQHENRSNQLRFPFNQRVLLGVWKKLYLDQESTLEANQSERARGEYLVKGLGHCGACHTPRTLLGAENYSLAFTGARIFDTVKSGQIRAWSSTNLTPAHEGIDNWTKQDIVDYLATGKNSHTVVHGPMNEVIANSTSFARPEDLNAIAAFISGLPPLSTQSHQDAPYTQGENLYTIHCGSCHLNDGSGDDILGVSLRNNAVVQSKDPATLINVVLYGPHLPKAPFVSDRSRMKMLGKRLSDEDISEILSFIRTSFDNRSTVVSVQDVAKQR